MEMKKVPFLLCSAHFANLFTRESCHSSYRLQNYHNSHYVSLFPSVFGDTVST